MPKERSKEPGRRRRSKEFESLVAEIAAELESSMDPVSVIPPEGQAETFADDERMIREWPDVADRMIEEIR
jgi:hypothetical protein